MNRPNLIGYKIPVNQPNVLALDATIAAAIQTATTNKLISPNAYTAVVADQDDQRQITTLNTGASIAAGARVAFGLFLPASKAGQNTIYKAVIAATFGGGLNAFAVIGKCPAASPVASTAAPSNQLSWYQVLPCDFTSGRFLFNNEILPNTAYLTTTDQPLALVFVIENTTGGAISITNLILSMSFSRYVQDYAAYTPNGR